MRRRRTKHQERNEEHAEYRAWLATAGCAVCDRYDVQLAHVGQGGTGLKHGDDDECIPLCLICHEDHDQTKGVFVRPTWAGKYEWRGFMREWDQQQIAVHRGRFEARNVGAQVVPF